MKRDSIQFEQILNATKQCSMVHVDNSLFSEIINNAKKANIENNSSFIKSNQIRHVAVVVFLLATINVFLLLTFSKIKDQKSKINASEQLINEYDIDR